MNGRRIHIAADWDILRARQEGRQLAAEIGFSTAEQALIATAISELARNIVEYAGDGEVLVSSAIDGAGRPGIEVVARDEGPGIPDTELAMKDGYSSGGGLGLGLPGTRRLVDEFELDSCVGRGTTITLRKWRGSP
jgi:serine/threonine-protein kinase RsbT